MCVALSIISTPYLSDLGAEFLPLFVEINSVQVDEIRVQLFYSVNIFKKGLHFQKHCAIINKLSVTA